MTGKKYIKIGAIISICGALIGVCGPIFQIFKALESFASGENAGIGAVGQSVYNSVYATIFSIIAILFGSCLMLFGIAKNRNR